MLLTGSHMLHLYISPEAESAESRADTLLSACRTLADRDTSGSLHVLALDYLSSAW